MRKTLSIEILVIIIIFTTLRLYSQESEIGFNVGYGKTVSDDYGLSIVNPYDKGLPNYFRLGFCYSKKPKSAPFNILTGVNYDYRGNNETRLNYIRFPLGIDFELGNKVQFIFGGGFFTSYLLSYKFISVKPDFEDSKRSLQIGWHGNLGFDYKISSCYSISAKYQISADIVKMYENKRGSPGGAQYTTDEKGFDGFILLNLKYHLGK